MFILNYFTLYTSDDFVYHFIYKVPFPNGNEEPVRNLLDLIQSQFNHWLIWNGRFTGHTIVQIFMQFDKVWFNVFNSLAFLILIILLNSLSLRLTNDESRRKSSLYLLTIFLMSWWFLPEIGKSVLWISGSGNYLWTMLIDLIWFSLFLTKNRSPYILLATIPIAFFSGAGNENTSPAMIMLLGLIWIEQCFIEKKVDFGKFIELLVATFGFLLMIFSPGSQKRAGTISIFQSLPSKLYHLTEVAFDKYVALYVLLVIGLIYLLLKKYITKNQLLVVTFIILAHFACIYSLIASNELPDRVFFGASVLLILSNLIVWRLALERKNMLKKLAILCLVPILIKFGFSYSNALTDIYSTYKVVEVQYQEIENAKKRGKNIVTLKRYSQPRTLFNAYNGTANLGPSKDDWFNKWMATYFGIEGIESTD